MSDVKSDRSTRGLGLLSQAGLPVPLKEINVDIKIIGFVAEVTSSLLYSNAEENPIEAEFTFPVDDGSAVFKFEAEIEGRHIVAEIQEKEQAKLTFNDAVEKGSTAMLMKEDDKAGDIFQCTLGNLPPKTDAKISFSYVIELPQEPDGKIRFTLPTVLNPRYSPDVGGVEAAEGATYAAPAKIPYKFSMVGNVRGYHKVLSVTSEQDKLKVEPLEDKSTSVSLVEDFKFDHDLSFLVEYENCYTPQVVLEPGTPEARGMMKEDLLMVNFYPKLEENATSTIGEYIFVIDRSGSMCGERIKNAKEALFLFLKSLPENCTFNVISFGSSYSSLFKFGSSTYNKSNLKEALSLQMKMDADMGGTEIYEPFKHIYGKKVSKGHPRQIILLTDGEVGNTDQLIGLVKKNAHNSRVFTLGIGSGVSTSLIKGVARAGNGKAEFITDKDRIQPKVISLLKCATQPAVSNIELKWELSKEITAVPIPKQPPTFIGLGERLCLYALLSGGKTQSSADQCSVTLTGESEGKPVEYKMVFTAVSESAVNQSAPLHRLAAKNQIKTLETEEADALDDENLHWRGQDTVSETRESMILVSKSANIISKMTAFVAVDKDAQKKVEGELVKRSCPVPVATKEFNDALYSNNLRGCGLYDASGVSSKNGASNIVATAQMMFATEASPTLEYGRTLPGSDDEDECSEDECCEDDWDETSDVKPQEDNIQSVIARGLNLKTEEERVRWEKEAKETFDNAVSELDSLCEDSYEDSTQKLQLLRDMITISSANLRCYSLGASAPKMKKGFGGFGVFSKLGGLVPSFKSKGKKAAKLSAGVNPSYSLDSTESDDQQPGTQDDKMLEMVALQEINGSWPLTTEVVSLLGVSEETLAKSFAMKEPDVIITMAVIAWLRSKFTKRHDEWEMIEKKALTWLSSKIDKDKTVEELIDEIKQKLWPSGP